MRRIHAAIVFAPLAMIAHQSRKRPTVEGTPIPFGLEGRYRFRCSREQQSRIGALGLRITKPIFGDDAEVAATTPRVRPPELAIGIGGVPRRGPWLRVSALGDRYDLHRVEVVRGETELAAEEAERATENVATDTDVRILA